MRMPCGVFARCCSGTGTVGSFAVYSTALFLLVLILTNTLSFHLTKEEASFGSVCVSGRLSSRGVGCGMKIKLPTCGFGGIGFAGGSGALR